MLQPKLQKKYLSSLEDLISVHLTMMINLERRQTLITLMESLKLKAEEKAWTEAKIGWMRQRGISSTPEATWTEASTTGLASPRSSPQKKRLRRSFKRWELRLGGTRWLTCFVSCQTNICFPQSLWMQRWSWIRLTSPLGTPTPTLQVRQEADTPVERQEG